MRVPESNRARYSRSLPTERATTDFLIRHELTRARNHSGFTFSQGNYSFENFAEVNRNVSDSAPHLQMESNHRLAGLESAALPLSYEGLCRANPAS